MTKTLGRGATRSQKSLNVFAAVALVASLITVYLPLPAQAAAGATYEFIFSNGEVLSGSTGGGDAAIDPEFFHDYYGGHDNVPFDHHSLSLHVSCSETYPGGWESNDGSFPDNPNEGGDSGHGDWHIASYTIERNLGSGQIRNCGETFDPGSIKVIKHTDPETSDSFTFDLHGDIPPAPGTSGTDWSAFDDTQAVAGNDGMYTWTGLKVGEYTLGEDTGLNPTDYSFESLTCSSDLSLFSYTTDGASASFDLHGGETITCEFTNVGSTPEPGTIIVEKEVTQGSDTATAFTFNETGFSLDDNTLADGESGSASVAPGGDYSVSESVLEGWTLQSATCDDDDSTPGDINVSEGETVTCTFVNHEIQPGTVTVIKNVIGDQSAEFTFTGDVAGTIGHSESISEVADLDVTYSSTEVVPAGWDLTDISCVADGGTFDIGATGVNMTVTEEDGSVTCTFTNTEDGEIVVEKEVLGNSDQTRAFEFTSSGFTLGDTTLAHGEQASSGLIAPGGEYSVSETVPEGWTLVSATCSDGSDPSDIDVAAGETVTCTFVNGELPTITVAKETLPVDPEDDTTFAFTGDLSGNLGDGDSTSATVEPGTYQTTEGEIEDWTLVSIACDDGATGDVESLTATYEVGYGDDITCTFTNVETQVLASVLVTVSGACIPDGDEGIGRITVNMSVDGAANVVVRDSDGDVVGSRSTSGTITVPEGATYTWEASAGEGFEFPVDFDPTGEVTIDTCSEDEELPFTGLNTDIALAIAALMLVAGLMMVRSTTRWEES